MREQMLADLWISQAPSIRRAARRALRDRDAAEDVTAGAFLRLAEMLGKEYAVENVEGLLFRIAQGLIVNEQRARYARPVPQGLSTRLRTNSFLHESLATFHDELDVALRALPDEQRNPFILIHLRGLTVRETAGILGHSRSSVFDRSEAAKTSLRKALTK